MSKSQKGSAFERWVCVELSKWWTDGERDDIFWRSSGSGARAATRSKKGRQTRNHYGDITVSDPIGQPLLDLFTIELKRGYSSRTIHDLLDKSDGMARQTYEEWFGKIKKTSEEAGTYAWLLITKRDRREPLVFFPRRALMGNLSILGPVMWHGDIAGETLQGFLANTGREDIESYWRSNRWARPST